MKPIVLTAEQRKEIERRRKETLDRRIYQRLTAVLAVASGKSREEVAELLGVSLSQLGEWLRVFRNEGSTHSAPSFTRATSATSPLTRFSNSRARSPGAASVTPTRSDTGFTRPQASATRP